MADLATLRRSSRLRVLSVVVLLVVSAVAVVGCLVTRQVVSDQERKLLKQRAEEAALYLSSAVSSVQTELASLAATAAATGQDAKAFEKSTALLTVIPGGFKTVALVSASDPPTVLASTGTGLEQGLGAVRAAAIRTAVAKEGLTGSLVATPRFAVGSSSRIGFAYASPSLDGAVVYAESEIQTTEVQTTQSQPFSELIAKVYAGPHASADQVIAASSGAGRGPLSGQTVSVPAPVGQGAPWLLVAKARHALVGSVATWTPWVILGVGLLVALLATGVVEALARRREYALGLVDVRTQELQQSLADLAVAHEQLVRQERLAAIGQLASTVGHELRNPLGVISNAVYLLRGDLGPEPTPAAERHLTTAEREVSAATVIVTDLLEFARQRHPMHDDVDLGALVTEVLGVLPPPTGVSVDRAGVKELVAPVDRDMMRQVLLNLIGNAYQAMPDGGRLTVEITNHDGAARIRVADTGAGMSEEVREHLFEPFFTTKARGVGLGLAVTRGIIDAHNGTVTVTSETGKGSEFVVLLPMIAAPRMSEESAPAHQVMS